MTPPDERVHFSWSLAPEISGRTVRDPTPDLATHLRVCFEAEELGLDAMHVPSGLAVPEPFTWSAALGARTRRIAFMVTTRAGTVPPVHLVQQTATLSRVLGGRVSLLGAMADISARSYGSDVGDEERDQQADEFWHICDLLWDGDESVDFAGRHYRVRQTRLVPSPPRPEMAFGGPMERLLPLARRNGDVLYDRPRPMADLVTQVRASHDAGLAVGLHMGLVPGATHEEAVGIARNLATSAGNVLSEMGNGLWMGVPHLVPRLPALVGGRAEIVSAIERYQAAGVSRYLFNGSREDLEWFGREVLPAVGGESRRAAG